MVLLAGCAPAAPAVIERSCVDPESGNLVAFWMVLDHGADRGKREPVLVTYPHAVFVQWPREGYYPNSAAKRLFMVYDNVAKKSYLTRDFDAFLTVISNLPRDTVIGQFDTCTMSRNGMPRDLWSQATKILAEKDPAWAQIRSNDLTESGEAWYTRTVTVCYGVYEWDFIFPGDE